MRKRHLNYNINLLKDRVKLLEDNQWELLHLPKFKKGDKVWWKERYAAFPRKPMKVLGVKPGTIRERVYYIETPDDSVVEIGEYFLTSETPPQEA